MNQDIKYSLYLHVLAIGLVLFLFGLALLLLVQSWALDQQLQKRLPVVLELKGNYHSDSLALLLNILKGQKEIQTGSIKLITKEHALDEMKGEIPSSIMMSAEENPFNDIIMFRLRVSSHSSQKLDDLKRVLAPLKLVQNVVSQTEQAASLIQYFTKIKKVFIILTFALGLIALGIIWYLIRVYVNDRMEVINLMHSLGSSPENIAKPYIRRGWIQGLASTCISIFFLGTAVFLLYNLAPWLYEMIELKNFFLIVIVLLIIGPTLQVIMIRRQIHKMLTL
ncbi:MAG: hypothetical protein M3Q56_02230 [Bacteroidota bacterium]|nr:hypothetical protein [Bacteroidota bacterium]